MASRIYLRTTQTISVPERDTRNADEAKYFGLPRHFQPPGDLASSLVHYVGDPIALGVQKFMKSVIGL